MPLADWLALREAVDHVARSASSANMRALVDALPGARPLRVLDLGTGTGSNIRYLSPRLPSPQSWVAVDRDAHLLARLPAGVTTRCLELGDLGAPGLFDQVHLVTASALLDLVSKDWIVRLARHCRDAGAAALFALNYDGRSSCSPVDGDDEFVREQFNRHQRSRDKGFGLAAGPQAADEAATAFGACGYQVRCERSDWILTPDMIELQVALIEGWAHATREIAPHEIARIDAWLARRLEHVHAGCSRIEVGHQDIVVSR
jgi:SAM-dependent methyltransferase